MEQNNDAEMPSIGDNDTSFIWQPGSVTVSISQPRGQAEMALSILFSGQ